MAYKLGKNSPLFQEQKELPEKEGKKRRGRPFNNNLVRGSSVQEGLTADFRRATYLMKVELVEKVKDYAYTERIDIKTAVNKLVAMGLRQEEKRLKKEGIDILKRNKGKEEWCLR